MKTAIVAGLGAMGSAAAEHLAAAGYRVLGFDRYQPPHTLGSSHGNSRIVRQCYFEDPRYVPLALRAFELWERLERDAQVKLLHLIGALMVGPATGILVPRSQQSAEAYGLEHRMLSASSMRQQYPQFRSEGDTIGLWEKTAGYVVPEDCVTAQLKRAAAAGAQLHFDEPMISWAATSGGGVTIRTARDTYQADRLVIATGAWSPQLLAAVGLPLQATRQIVHWILPRANADIFAPAHLPVFMCERVLGERIIYGFPALEAEEGVKVGIHGSDHACTPETVAREPLAADTDAILARTRQSMPLLSGPILRSEVCLYTMTPDEHFVIDRHPDSPQVALAAGFSGHGFKFANAVGEILAALEPGGSPRLDISLFALDRFRNRSQSSI
jgi:sarcosine oxidase